MTLPSFPTFKKILISSALLCSVTATWSQSLEQTIEKVLVQHPKLRVASSTARSVKYEIKVAEAAKNPKFSSIVDAGYSHSEKIQSDGQASTGWNRSGDLGLRGTYLLFDAKRSDNEISRQQARFVTAQERVAQTQETLTTQVTDAYLEVMKQEKLEQLAKDNFAAHQALRAKVYEIVKIDKGRQYDLTQVEARTQQAQVTLSSRQGAAQEARALLADLAGGPVTVLQAPRDPSSALPATQTAALDQLSDHPSLRAAQSDTEVARRAAAVAGAWAYPRVDAQGTVNSPKNSEGQRQYFTGYDVRLAVQWQPFDGGAGRAGADAAAEQLNAAKDNEASVRRDLSNDVTRFWSQVETRRSRSGAWLDLLKQTEQVRENYWQQFTIGKRSILDLLNAENEAFQSRLSAEQERLETQQSQYRLLGSLAQIGLFLGVSRGKENLEKQTQLLP
jgi:outer membrane protein, adhesin transport system